MEDAEIERLRRAVLDHRHRAHFARAEAATRPAASWGHTLLGESAAYYERRAEEAELALEQLATMTSDFSQQGAVTPEALRLP